MAANTTDTAGFTDLLFGAYDVVGLEFSPRIRDLADQRLWRLDDTKLPTRVASLLPNRVNIELIVAPCRCDCSGRPCRGNLKGALRSVALSAAVPASA